MKSSVFPPPVRRIRNGHAGGACASHELSRGRRAHCSCVARSRPRRRMRAMTSSGTILRGSRPPRMAGSRPNCSRAVSFFRISRSARRCCRARSRWRCPGPGRSPGLSRTRISSSCRSSTDARSAGARVVDGRPGQLVARQIEQRLAARVIGPWLDLGFFNWYSTGKPLNSYADLKGLKIRNSGGAGQGWRTQFMGAVPNTTPLPNVALALSQGTFDGLITTNETIASAQFWESGIRHALEDHQFIGEYIPIISLAFWQRLSPALQETFTETWRENIQTYRASMSAAQVRAREMVQSHGVRSRFPPHKSLPPSGRRCSRISNTSPPCRRSRLRRLPLSRSCLRPR